LIKGIEFSVAWRQHDLHILGLNLKVETPSLQQLVAKHKTVRLERAKAIAKQLESIGIEGALAGAKRFAHSNEITRPHFASYLIEQKKAKDMRSAFKQYLGRGKVGYVRAPWSSLAKAVTVIKEAGGLPVIAHPLRYGLTRTKLLELIADFKACGGQGMEVISGLTSVRERETLLSLCRTHDLLGSVGSDFHSELVKPFCFGQLPTLNTSLACVWDHFV
jgi:predicted metal-dependent phosphoesterase TrpH